MAAYCGHETDAQAQHLGHHEHQHAGSAVLDDHQVAAGEGGLAAVDFDCGHCHSSGCSMPAVVGSLTPLASASHPLPPVESSVRTLAQQPPERPQWLRLA